MVLLTEGVLNGSVFVDGSVEVTVVVRAGELVVSIPELPVFPVEEFPAPEL